MASHMSQIREVRQALLNPQRDCFEIERGLVAEGRDCGTVVFPKAPLKIYLTATEGTRGKRRYEQNRGNQRDDEEVEVNGGGETLSQILSNQEFRDRQDSTRRTAPLKPPEGSLVIDSTSLNMSQVVNQILAYARKLWDGL